MKWFLLLAALIGGLTIFGSTSTANAAGYRVRYTPYGYRAVYHPRYGYPAPVVAAPGVVVMGPRVRVAPVYAYPTPVIYGPGYAYPGTYGW
jgi:hypothetical protein